MTEIQAPPLTAPRYGVHSEVGRLRTVLTCAPGLAHHRLTPSNCHDLLFDDVMWVENAQRDHAGFVSLMRERGIEVLELHSLLAEVLALPTLARGFSIARSLPRRWGWAWPRTFAPTSTRWTRSSLRGT
ncbi:hypothetical protein GCM10025873_13810 [Demequina sediminis]|nr:hypothetical protein GCM10025873_13810 [Demequina sediminis]